MGKQYFKLLKITPESHPYQSKLEVNFAVDMWIKSFLIGEYSLKQEKYFLLYERSFDKIKNVFNIFRVFHMVKV